MMSLESDHHVVQKNKCKNKRREFISFQYFIKQKSFWVFNTKTLNDIKIDLEKNIQTQSER